MVDSPYLYVTSTGVIVPDTSNILVGVQDEYKAALGTDLVTTSDTPQGVLITAEALARDEVVNNNAAVANQINPNIAAGIFLDAIMALTGLQRTVATPTVVPDVLLTGVAGTTIPAGTQAQTATGDVFQSLATVVIGMDGTITVDFASVVYGPIACGADTLTQIVTNVLGWETVTNPEVGILGANTQSDQSARALRSNTLGFQGVALAVAITSALYNVTGVQSLWFQENITAGTTTINGISMVAHSIYVCVNGGSDLDVAAALLENKSSGCAWNGGTSVDVIEPASGQTYTVKFDRPDEIAIAVKVTTPNGDSANVIQAILDYAAGNINGLQGFVVGSDVSAFELAGAITAEFPSTFVSKVEISYVSMISYTTDVLPIAVDEIATVSAINISVVSS